MPVTIEFEYEKLQDKPGLESDSDQRHQKLSELTGGLFLWHNAPLECYRVNVFDKTNPRGHVNTVQPLCQVQCFLGCNRQTENAK